MGETSSSETKLVLHVENDPKARADVEAAVASIPGHTLVTFADYDSLLKWLMIPADQRKPEEAFSAVKLMLWTTDGLAGKDDVNTWRIRAVTLGVPPETPVVLTTSEAPDVALPKWLQSVAFNLLQKPYDALLLRLHLILALGEKSTGENALLELKTDSIVEALKTVPMTALSEVGFVTRSDMELPVGRVAKFYGDVFSSGEARSVYARTLDQGYESDSKTWKVRLTFFGTGRDQMLRIRSRFSPSKEKNFEWTWMAPPTRLRFYMIGDPSAAGSELSIALTRNFKNLDVVPTAAPPDEKANLPDKIDAVFVHLDFLEKIEKDRRFDGVRRLVLSERAVKEEEMRSLLTKAIDLVTVPTERVSFFKKLAVLFPGLEPSEDRPIKTYDWPETLNAGLPVRITEMSEAYLIECYERALPPGTIRRFVLWYPAEKDTPVLTGRCYKSVADPASKGSFLNHFVFFGMSDREAKHIRLWIRDNYILSKQKN